MNEQGGVMQWYATDPNNITERSSFSKGGGDQPGHAKGGQKKGKNRRQDGGVEEPFITLGRRTKGENQSTY